jgi:hypothetical protein
MRLSDRRSIVGIDVTTRGLAFIFFENGEPFDWGECVRRPADLAATLDTLLDSCAAERLVLEDPDAHGSKRHPRIRSLLRELAAHARRRECTVVVVSRKAVRRVWAGRGRTNKEAVAAAIATRFGHLAGIVPPTRKTGWNEDSRVNIFDAASLVLHYDETH